MKEITIKAGKHRPGGLHFGLNLFRSRIRHTAVFKASCRYYLPAPDHLDINKLFGLSQGLHWRNSARIGWRYSADLDRIELFAYAYVRGVRNFEESKTEKLLLGRVRIGEACELEILITKGSYQFYLNDLPPVIIQRARIWNLGYTLHPYFGGNRAAPNDIHLKLMR